MLFRSPKPPKKLRNRSTRKTRRHQSHNKTSLLSVSDVLFFLPDPQKHLYIIFILSRKESINHLFHEIDFVLSRFIRGIAIDNFVSPKISSMTFFPAMFTKFYTKNALKNLLNLLKDYKFKLAITIICAMC